MKSSYLHGIMMVSSIMLIYVVFTRDGSAQTYFRDVTKQPVLSYGAAGTWDDAVTWNPAVIKDGDTLRMWYTGHNESIWTTSTIGNIGYAWSLDGYNWNKVQENPVVTATLDWEDGHLYGCAVMKDGNTLKMWYGAAWSSSSTEYTISIKKIGYAESTDGRTWIKNAEPVLTVGSEFEWDSDVIVPTSVIKEGNEYKMWYWAGKPGFPMDASLPQVGLATSLDGINWMKYNDPTTAEAPYSDSDPVLQVGSTDEWDAQRIIDPIVLTTNAGYEMWYTGLKGPITSDVPQQIGYATSDDGIHWTKWPDNPIIKDSLEWGKGIYGGSVLKYDQVYHFWFACFHTPPTMARPQIGYANSNDKVYIPDTAFLYALIEEGVDTNGDSLISYGEAEVVKSLNISAFDWDMEYISDMTGIEAFIELEVLECDGHNLTSLNISNNTELWYLSVSRNQLTSLDVSSSTKLEALSCSNNQLTTLDVSKNTNLSGTDWHCFGCQKSINLIPWYGHPGLDCSNNLLTSLDVSSNTKLEALDCRFNQLNSLNVSGCDSLTYLGCQGNQLTDLDISNNTDLEYLDCSRMQLTNLDISNNMDIEELWIGENESLYEVCVWEDFSLDSILVDRIGSQKVCFQTDCNGDCSTGITITIKIDTMYQPVNIEVQSSQNGMIYLVPENTDQVIEVIREACIDSFEVVVNTPVFIPQEGIENGTYWLYGTDNSGNISEPKAYTIMGVGIDNQNAENLRIFPNPTYTKLTIVMSMIDRFNVNITSLNGQLILSKEMEGTTHQLDLSPFQKGVYFITIRSKDFVTTRKIVKL